MSDKGKVYEGLPEGLANVGEWLITEFVNEEMGLTLRGRFRLSPFQKLDAEQTKFLLTFLRCRGVLSSVEKELGMSYPTVRARLDGLLKALGLVPAEVSPEERNRVAERRREVLEKLESGEISPEEAKKLLKEAVSNTQLTLPTNSR
ncbi:MAG: DUF2089 domain-containing protein, partial [Fimbriimonadales bacterium]|nr:DUF2089 domain-containing protein [Fimbriimonadales bacterium]